MKRLATPCTLKTIDEVSDSLENIFNSDYCLDSRVMFHKRSDSPNSSLIQNSLPINKRFPVRFPRFIPIVSPIRPERPVGLRAYLLNLDDKIMIPSHLTNSTGPFNTSLAANEPSICQHCSGGRSSASRPRSKVYDFLLPSSHGRMKQAPNRCPAHCQPNPPHITRRGHPKSPPHPTP